MAIILVAGVAALAIAWLLGVPYLAERRRRRIREEAFPAAWREVLQRRVPHYRRLPADLRAQLEKHIQVFVAEKPFIGCGGLRVTDEVRVTIAAQACLLILNRRSYYFPNLREILVYPGTFLVERSSAEPAGVVRERQHALSGESWPRGQVVISWEDAVEGAAIVDDGRNVVIHEFAHHLDQEKGYANGAPWLGRRDRYPRWSRVMNEEFAVLRARATMGEPSLFSHYGATSPAEFFAVASEVFFERPRDMAALHPAMYETFRGLYRVDPSAWPAAFEGIMETRSIEGAP